MLTVTERGLYCAAGDFYIDPWRSVDRALITHAHSDHARPGSRSYLCAEEGTGVLRLRLGAKTCIQGLHYGTTVLLNGVRVSFHPAGHVLGSAQIRLEHRDEVWVVSGDYKTEPDPTCSAFEPVRCEVFVTESTFGLPIYRWPPAAKIFAEINDWWRGNQSEGRTSVLGGYSLGKAQRLMAGIDPHLGPLHVHAAILEFLPAYAAAGFRLPEAGLLTAESVRRAGGQALVIAPPGSDQAGWLPRKSPASVAFASGWMLVRGARRRPDSDRGFPVSDHADWPGLLATIRATGAGRILVTHGSTGPLVRWLNENGWQAETLATRFEGEAAETAADPELEPAPSMSSASTALLDGPGSTEAAPPA